MTKSVELHCTLYCTHKAIWHIGVITVITVIKRLQKALSEPEATPTNSKTRNVRIR
jgi:hypothetical protein